MSVILTCCKNSQNDLDATYERYESKRYKQAFEFVEEIVSKDFSLPSGESASTSRRDVST
jgi:hypothetical protein